MSEQATAPEMIIGKKYLLNNHTGSNLSIVPMIFIGYGENKTGNFISDNQVLFDVLEQPYSQDALIDYLNNHSADEVNKVLKVFTYNTVDKLDTPLWMDEEQASLKVKELEKELQFKKRQLNRLQSIEFYKCDCPGGEVYQDFIQQFKKLLSSKGYSSRSYTFHADINPNGLCVCHNGSGDDDQYFLFDELTENPKYSRMEFSYCCESNQPKV